MRFRPIYCLLILALKTTILAQSYRLKMVNADNKAVFKELRYKEKHSSYSDCEKEISNVIAQLHFKGYLLAGADSVKHDSLNVICFLNIGQKFKWANLKKGNVDMEVMSSLGYYEKLYTNATFNYTGVAKLIEKTISYYENNGYPFVSLKLDSVTINGNSISAVLNVNRNKLFRIDSVIVQGDAHLNPTFLYRYLNVRPQMPYNETALRGISNKIKQLSFVTETKAPVFRPTDKLNKLYLFLNKRNASQFDGIIGILPDNTGKTIFTGDVKIKLINNIFHSGETFDLNWRRLQTQTQDFRSRVIYPYLFGTPLGTDYTLKIYKRDTSFIDVNNNIGLQYYFSGLNNMKVYYKQRNANILSTYGLAALTVLPDYADVTTRSYGLGFYYERLDYRFNPHNGIALNLNSQAGNKSIKKNSKINDAAYTNVILKSVQYQSEGDVNVYIRLKGHNVLRLGTQYATVFGNSTLFKNELFRIGGLKTLRGFDEESIYASSYVIPTLEYRFLFGQNSNILLFAEGAWYENNSGNNYVKDTPYSVGAGINFDTKAGIFSLNYAIGSQFGNTFDFRTGKIHFGLTALF